MLWNLNAPDPWKTPIRLQQDGDILRFVFSADSRWLVSTDRTGSMRRWDLSIQTLKAKNSNPLDMSSSDLLELFSQAEHDPQQAAKLRNLVMIMSQPEYTILCAQRDPPNMLQVIQTVIG